MCVCVCIKLSPRINNTSNNGRWNKTSPLTLAVSRVRSSIFQILSEEFGLSSSLTRSRDVFAELEAESL